MLEKRSKPQCECGRLPLPSGLSRCCTFKLLSHALVVRCAVLDLDRAVVIISWCIPREVRSIITDTILYRIHSMRMKFMSLLFALLLFIHSGSALRPSSLGGGTVTAAAAGVRGVVATATRSPLFVLQQQELQSSRIVRTTTSAALSATAAAAIRQQRRRELSRRGRNNNRIAWCCSQCDSSQWPHSWESA